MSHSDYKMSTAEFKQVVWFMTAVIWLAVGLMTIGKRLLRRTGR